MSSSLADTTPVHFPQGRGMSLGSLRVILLPTLLPSALALTPKLPEAVLYLKEDSRVNLRFEYTDSTAMLHGGIQSIASWLSLAKCKIEMQLIS